MPADILYLGDTTLETAAGYLAGVIAHAKWQFDYVPSHESPSMELIESRRKLFILSDYPANRLPNAAQTEVAKQVEQGAGLLMIGGWESFQGSGGLWRGTAISELLPVEIDANDDRRNCDSPVFAVQEADHEILSGLPWQGRTPLIGGYNAVTVKDGSHLLLTARRYSAQIDGETPALTVVSWDPLLAVREHGDGRVAALMTDLAPHWVGPLVDWGNGRVSAQAPGAEAIEVGNHYAQFVKQLLAWTGRLDIG
ncbi:MAG: hypothetical protein KDA80_15445 [Planctomycetaceae bacterium]|nr:hypothetical protein [Planctomycetaceae bacterium]